MNYCANMHRTPRLFGLIYNYSSILPSMNVYLIYHCWPMHMKLCRSRENKIMRKKIKFHRFLHSEISLKLKNYITTSGCYSRFFQAWECIYTWNWEQKVGYESLSTQSEIIADVMHNYRRLSQIMHGYRRKFVDNNYSQRS